MKNMKTRALACLCAFTLCLSGLCAGAEVDDGARTYYEIFVYSFRDGNGDGIGDFRGAAQAIPYIRDMGFTGIWLMPVSAAASYHKYDVIDYAQIDPEYGTLEDFEAFMSECGENGIRVILDLVVNHTSDKHPWFQSAAKSAVIKPCGQNPCAVKDLCREHNPYCGYYNFIDAEVAPTGYTYLGGGVCYESVFWSGMPDLNLSNTAVRRELENVIDFYMDRGAAGFRLDAAMHFGHSRGESIEALSWICDYVKERDENAYLVAEVWTGLSEMMPYYESGVNSLFNFAFGTATGRTAKTLVYKGKANSASAYQKSLLSLQTALDNAGGAIDAPFGSNHDTGRISGFMRRDEAKIKMYAALNLTMTGCAFVYYGEELGMSGSGIDENMRAPMYWTRDNSAEGMTRGPVNMETQIHAFGALDEQANDPESIYSFYKSALAVRNLYPEIAYGRVSEIDAVAHADLCAIQKTWRGESIYILYNCSENETIEATMPTGIEIVAELRAARSSEGAVLEGTVLKCPPMTVTFLKCK